MSSAKDQAAAIGVSNSTAALVVRRRIRAPASELFAAWTDPAQLLQWWGPKGVVCTEAILEPRVGGAYRLGNRLASGRVVWITGEFERFVPPSELVFSWRVDGQAGLAERVTVQFMPAGDSTDVIVTHEHIADATTRSEHEMGWVGCLAGLSRLVADRTPGAQSS